jgi:ADP-ribose pyrophosphatase
MSARPVLAAAGLADTPMLWPLRGRQILGRGAVQNFVNDDVETPDGALMRRQYTQHPGAVAVLAWNDADQVAVIRQYRQPVGMELVELPAGLLDHADEDYLLAAKRELAEEVALSAGEWRVLTDLFSTPGATQESLRIYLATGLREIARPDGFALEDEEAAMGVYWAAREDLLDAIFAGRVQNPSLLNGLLALEAARRSGRLDSLRPADAPWPARAAVQALNALA